MQQVVLMVVCAAMLAATTQGRDLREEREPQTNMLERLVRLLSKSNKVEEERHVEHPDAGENEDSGKHMIDSLDMEQRGLWDSISSITNDAVQLFNSLWKKKCFSGHCYYMPIGNNYEELTKSEANRKCRDMGKHLLAIESATEKANIIHMMAGSGLYATINWEPSGSTKAVWLWMYDDCSPSCGQWRYQNKNRQSLSYKDWYSGEPSSNYEKCSIALQSTNENTNYQWHDVKCDRSFSYICEDY